MDQKPKRRRGLGQMKPLDRLLALNAGLLGIGAYLLALLARDIERLSRAERHHHSLVLG